MKVGDYVRTEKGVIGKYNIVKTGETIPNWNGGYGYKEIEKEYIDYFLKEGHTKNWKQFEYSLLEILDKGSDKN